MFANPNHIKFIKCNVAHQNYEPEEIHLIFEKERNVLEKSRDPNENHTIRFSMSENPTVDILSSYLQKWCILCYFFPEQRSWMRVYL